MPPQFSGAVKAAPDRSRSRQVNDYTHLEIEQLRARVRELEQAADEPIAIVGYAVQFPGAPDTDTYWGLLQSGADAVIEIPSERWDVDAFYDSDPEALGKMYTRRAGFMA